MAKETDTTNRPRPQQAADDAGSTKEPLLIEVDVAIHDLCMRVGVLDLAVQGYAARIGEAKYDRACLNWAGGEAMTAAEAIQDYWNDEVIGLTGKGGADDVEAASTTIDVQAWAAWSRWYHAAAEACRAGIARTSMADDPRFRADAAHVAALADADALSDRLYNARDAAEAALTGTSPVALAARIHAILRRTGGFVEAEGEDVLQTRLRGILADLAPMLPTDMQTALADPYAELPEGGDR